MSELPEGWESAPIGSLCSLVNGRAFKPSDWSTVGLPIVRIQNLNNPDASFNHFDGEFDKRFRLFGGELLFAWSGTPGTSFGAHIWRGGEAVLNQHIFRVDFDENSIDKRFFRYAINQKLDELINIAHGGVGLRHVTKGKFENTEVVVPPLAEQKRIADKLDALLARVDRCRARLERVPLILKRFRQAVLAAATSGQLTEDWREKNHNNSSSVEQLLELIEQQRNQLWESKTSNRRYSTPVKYDEYSLPEIPDSWHWSSADALCSQVTDGEHIQPPYQSHGYPMLTAKHVRDGFVTFEDVGYVSESDFRKCLERCAPENGDILIVSVGATTGRSAIVENSNPFAIVRSVLLLKPLIPSKYLLRWVQSPWCFKWMTQASGASAQAHLYIKDTKRMPVPVPPLEEQHEIVRRVEILFAYADRLETRYQAARAQVARLTPALLAQAFRGELVAQDPADEPAALLLARIKGR